MHAKICWASSGICNAVKDFEDLISLAPAVPAYHFMPAVPCAC